VATNHRGRTPEHPDHARRFRSVERQRHLEHLLAGQTQKDDLVDAFLRAPLHSREYAQGFGTLYTAAYRPAEGRVDYRWPGQSWTRTFDAPDATTQVMLRQS
jgi:predicted choloylglycine hydrolase